VISGWSLDEVGFSLGIGIVVLCLVLAWINDVVGVSIRIRMLFGNGIVLGFIFALEYRHRR